MDERLEEIMSRISSTQNGMPKGVITWKGWEPVVTVFTKDVEYLIERVQELERDKAEWEIESHTQNARNKRLEQQFNELYRKHFIKVDQLEKENQRYKEAMEFAVRYLSGSELYDIQSVVNALQEALKGES